MHLRALIVVLVLASAAGCPARHAGTPTNSASRAPVRGSHVRASRAPTVEGTRWACLRPPHTPAEDATALADGTPVKRERDGRRWVVSFQGDVGLSPQQESELATRLRQQKGPMVLLTWGLYCGDHAPEGLCLRYEADLCTVGVEEIARSVRLALANDPVAPRARMRLVIGLIGDLGPRCEEGASCGPVPYEAGSQYRPEAPRKGGALLEYSLGACRHDGDCVVQGCGNSCVNWEYGGAHNFATCEGYSFASPAFCGCVEGQCEWFTQ